MAEWLRRVIRNHLGSSRAGSNPVQCVLFIISYHHFKKISSTEATELAPFSVQVNKSDASESETSQRSQEVKSELKTEPLPKRRPQIIIKIYLQPTFDSTSGYSTQETSSLTANSVSIT